MNTSLLREKLLGHWKEKLVCFVMALAIYQSYKIQQFETGHYTVPLEVKAAGNLAVKTGFALPQYVRVNVRAERGELGGITANDMEAFIDVSYAPAAGRYELLVNVRPNRRLVDISPLEISVQPQKIAVEVEEEIVRFVPISVTTSGEPAYGYQSGAISASPSSVRVQGPRTAVMALSQIQTEELQLDGASANITREVGFLNLSSLAQIDAEATVEVTIAITPTESSRTLRGIEIIYENVPAGFEISHDGSTVDITVEGAQLRLDSLRANSCSVIADCSGVTEPGETNVPVFVHVPDGLSVNTYGPHSVPVTFVEKERDGSGEENDFGYYFPEDKP